MMKSDWITLWGFGADINAVGKTLFIRKKASSKVERYPLETVSHLLIAGDNTLHTSVLRKCAEHQIPISFFDIHGKPIQFFENEKAVLADAQKEVAVHSYTLCMMTAALDSRLRYLHELSETHNNLYYQGEFDILTQTRRELEYLITLPELERAYSLTRTMYYEILSRAVPPELGFHRLTEGPAKDSVNLLISMGTAMLISRISVACVGAGLNKDIGAVAGGCVREIMEPALAFVVDRPVLDFAQEKSLRKIDCSRYSLPEDLKGRFTAEIVNRMEMANIEENVQAYATAVKEHTLPVYHFPK